MKDAQQKENLYRHFRAQGWYADIEIPIYFRDGVYGSSKLITDIDVFGLRPTNDLCWEIILGDCKTKRGESSVNRALWLRGLMDKMGAKKGICLLKPKSGRIEIDHRLFANQLGITLIEEREFSQYDRATLFPEGSVNFDESAHQLQLARRDVGSRFPKLKNIIDFLDAGVWNSPDHFTMMRHLTVKGYEIRGEIDPAKPEHLWLLLESVGVFAVGLASCVGSIFRSHLQPENRQSMEQALNLLLWGGRDKYEWYSNVRKQLVSSGGTMDSDTGNLSLPAWSTFLELVRHHLESPKLSFLVPQILRYQALKTLSSVHIPWRNSPQQLMKMKLAMQTAVYFAEACSFSSEIKKEIKDLFLRAIDQLMSLHERDVDRVSVAEANAGNDSDTPEEKIQRSQDFLPGLQKK